VIVLASHPGICDPQFQDTETIVGESKMNELLAFVKKIEAQVQSVVDELHKERDKYENGFGAVSPDEHHRRDSLWLAELALVKVVQKLQQSSGDMIAPSPERQINVSGDSTSLAAFNVGDFIHIMTEDGIIEFLKRIPGECWMDGKKKVDAHRLMQLTSIGWRWFGKSSSGWMYASDASAFTPGHMGWPNN
jgi:hypothetical protein